MDPFGNNNPRQPALPSPPSSPSECKKRRLSLSFIQNPCTESPKRPKSQLHKPSFDEDHRSLLVQACIKQSEEEIKKLIENTKLDVNLKSGPNCTTALHEFVLVGFDKGVRLLVQHPEIDINATDSCGQTALHYATQKNKADCLKILVMAGARTDISCKNGRLPIHIAALYGFVSCVDLLLLYVSHANNPDDLDMLWTQEILGQQNVVGCAIMGGHLGCLARLLQKDSNKTYQNKGLVSFAIQWNRIECLKMLLSFGCNADETCLRMAVQQRKIDLVRILISSGISPCLQNGQNPSFLYAANHGFLELIPMTLTLSTSKDCIQQSLFLASSIGLHKKLCGVISVTLNGLLATRNKST